MLLWASGVAGLGRLTEGMVVVLLWSCWDLVGVLLGSCFEGQGWLCVRCTGFASGVVRERGRETEGGRENRRKDKGDNRGKDRRKYEGKEGY